MLIGAALLALKQLTETSDNIRRYGLLQKLGASPQEIRRSLLWQTGLFFLLPLGLGSLYAIFFARQGMMIVEEFMNLHIAWNLWLVIALFMIVYTGYFLAAYTSCKHMVTERDV